MRESVHRSIAGHRVSVWEPSMRVPASEIQSPPPTMLLLNGAGLTSGGWHEVIALLPSWRAITVDHPGYAGMPRQGFPTLHAEVEALVEIVRVLGLMAPQFSDAAASVQSSGLGGVEVQSGESGESGGLSQSSQSGEPTQPAAPGTCGHVTIVAHSMGAFHAEALLRRLPGLASQVVLVDPSLPSRCPPVAPMARPLAHAAELGVRIPGAHRLAALATRRGLAHQSMGSLERWRAQEQQWEEVWRTPEAVAEGAAQWLSYREQARELWALRQEQGRPVPAHATVLVAPPVPSQGSLRATQEAFQSLRWRYVAASRHLMMVDAPGPIAREIARSAPQAYALRA